MKNDQLTQLWNSQKNDVPHESPEQIIRKARKQRDRQYISIAVMSITVLVLILYTLYYGPHRWNNFTFGLVLMISSLVFRVILEFVSLYQKENRLISLDSRSFQEYLKKHYTLRLKINYIITPICFAMYVFGFTKLLPYFKQEFSEGFYIYILISGFASFVILSIIIVNSILKESHFLRESRKSNLKKSPQN